MAPPSVRRGWLALATSALLAIGGPSASATASAGGYRSSSAAASHNCPGAHRSGHRRRACHRGHRRHHAHRAAAAQARTSRRRGRGNRTPIPRGEAGSTGATLASPTASPVTSGTANGTTATSPPTTTTTTTSPSTTTTTTTSSGPTTTTTTTPTGPARPSVYWGAYVGDQFTGGHPPWDWNAQTDFQNTDAGGKAPSLLPFGAPFYSSQWCSGYCTFPTSMFDTVRAAGMIPWFTWQTTADYTDAQIAAGAQDSYITAWAQAAKAWGHPFFLRFDWEMNGNWFPWGVGVDGNTPADYVAMWRHVHDIFTSVGATNATWVWCPNIDAPGSTYSPMSNLYPGAGYVDWVGLDAYNGDVPWTSFQNLISSTYGQLTAMAPGKPIVVGETGSTETGGSKATWITNLLSGLPTEFPQIHGLLWYDISSSGPGGHTDWPIESSSGSEAAFSAGIQSPVYAGNGYAGLNVNPIPRP